MNDKHRGSYILKLLIGLKPKDVKASVRHLYDDANNVRLTDREEALRSCRNALEKLDKPPETTLDESNKYAKGRFQLLIASIYLDKENEESENEESWREAEEHYKASKSEFHLDQYSHFASLACLGLAITRRKLGKFKEADDALENAQEYVNHESIPVDTEDLSDAIGRERQALSDDPLRPTSPPSVLEEKELPIFRISAGEAFVSEGGTTDLNLLTQQDYKRHAGESPSVGILNLAVWPQAKEADYILEIDEEVCEVDDDIEKGIWLLIRQQNNPENLKGKTVAVLVIGKSEKNRGFNNGDEGKDGPAAENSLYASTKVFSMAEDHYFLKARSKEARSIAVVHYKTGDYSKVRGYYTKYGEIDIRLVYHVRVSAEVIGSIRVIGTKKGIRKSYVWRLPRVSDVAAGLGPVPNDHIVDYVGVLENKRKDGAYFIVVVSGDSMAGDGIVSGSNALILQQEKVENRDIAAVVIWVPGREKPLIVLKRYYIADSLPEHLGHWFLESSNPSSEHLVVIPHGADVEAIRSLYDRFMPTRKIEFYEEAELSIAGKYIKLV